MEEVVEGLRMAGKCVGVEAEWEEEVVVVISTCSCVLLGFGCVCVFIQCVELNEDRVLADHLCKPDMCSHPRDATAFLEWEHGIKHLAAFSKTYMKLSGAFSELPPLPSHNDTEP